MAARAPAAAAALAAAAPRGGWAAARATAAAATACRHPRPFPSHTLRSLRQRARGAGSPGGARFQRVGAHPVALGQAAAAHVESTLSEVLPVRKAPVCEVADVSLSAYVPAERGKGPFTSHAAVSRGQAAARGGAKRGCCLPVAGAGQVPRGSPEALQGTVIWSDSEGCSVAVVRRLVLRAEAVEPTTMSVDAVMCAPQRPQPAQEFAQNTEVIAPVEPLGRRVVVDGRVLGGGQGRAEGAAKGRGEQRVARAAGPRHLRREHGRNAKRCQTPVAPQIMGPGALMWHACMADTRCRTRTL